MALSCLVLGGARSGKSRFAVERQSSHARVAFLATARPEDADMAARIARHRAERPHGWQTIEEPCDLPRRLHEAAAAADGIVVDCLTVWVANLQRRGDGDVAILAQADALARLAARPPVDLTLVSNEVGQGVHPATEVGLRFRDLLGGVNQRLAAACAEVIVMVAGLPLVLKAPGLAGGADARAGQAP